MAKHLHLRAAAGRRLRSVKAARTAGSKRRHAVRRLRDAPTPSTVLRGPAVLVGVRALLPPAGDMARNPHADDRLARATIFCRPPVFALNLQYGAPRPQSSP